MKILVADDEEDISFLVRFSLCRDAAGHEVVVANNGAEAVALFRYAKESGAPFDAAILDIGMPRMDGAEAALAIRQLDARVRILFLTGYSEDSDRARRAKLCPDHSGLHMKPDALLELPELVAQALEAVCETQTEKCS